MAACPLCGGSTAVLLSPGFYRCTSQRLVDMIPRGRHSNPTEVPLYEECGHTYQTGPRPPGAPACECGMFAVGTCDECGLPRCGNHGALNGRNRFVCNQHINAAALAPDYDAGRQAGEAQRAREMRGALGSQKLKQIEAEAKATARRLLDEHPAAAASVTVEVSSGNIRAYAEIGKAWPVLGSAVWSAPLKGTTETRLAGVGVDQAGKLRMLFGHTDADPLSVGWSQVDSRDWSVGVAWPSILATLQADERSGRPTTTVPRSQGTRPVPASAKPRSVREIEKAERDDRRKIRKLLTAPLPSHESSRPASSAAASGPVGLAMPAPPPALEPPTPGATPARVAHILRLADEGKLGRERAVELTRHGQISDDVWQTIRDL